MSVFIVFEKGSGGWLGEGQRLTWVNRVEL
jgi:hypothetical protein